MTKTRTLITKKVENKMNALLIFALLVGIAEAYYNESFTQQLTTFKKKHPLPVGIMTTSAGAPIEYRDTEGVLNSDLLQNEYFLESMMHFDRERIPERVVHAKGIGVFGYFEVIKDLSDITIAKVFSKVGKKTPVVVRFSPVFVERGGSDTTRETRGFGIKMYTEEGNLDLLTTNVETFVMKDPILFPTFVRAFKRNPKTQKMADLNALWDLITLRPETLNSMLPIFGDRGIPNGYRHMPGFTVHTFQLYNDHGEIHFVKFHILPDAGIDFLTSEEGHRIAGINPDFANEDLYDAVGREDFPSWTISVQVMSLHEVKRAKFDVFDITKRWPVEQYPLRPVGKLVLNKNVENSFAQAEQLAFNPANLVPGILGGVDKVFAARRLSYRDSQIHRLGVNFNKIEVNSPLHKPLTYNRDGYPPVKDNEGETPNYYPNSFSGPVPYVDKKRPQMVNVYTNPDADNFDQANDLYENMSKGEKFRLGQNLVGSLIGVAEFLQKRALETFKIINIDLAKRVEYGLMTNNTKWEYYDEKNFVAKNN